MSKVFSGKINKKCIDEHLLEDVLVKFFSPKSLIKEVQERWISYEGISDRNDNLCIAFVNEEDWWECDIINGKFEFEL